MRLLIELYYHGQLLLTDQVDVYPLFEFKAPHRIDVTPIIDRYRAIEKQAVLPAEGHESPLAPAEHPQ
ncbi:hypothetical protein LCGC14_1554930 [marine sediment metagenome]|uniref:Uncharacterized protein n=1 Tax=marine sediment metagenome TaxID=412755 RepID=A0A0F9IP81_9ZZZZ